MKDWHKKLIWFIGLILLVIVLSRLEYAAHQRSEATFNINFVTWTTFIPFIFGVYLSLLLINRSMQFNVSLFVCVFLPSFIFGFYVPLADITHFPIPFRFFLYDNHGIMILVSGFTLMLSLFSLRK